MKLYIPQAELRSCVNPETGSVYGVVSHVCKSVNSLIMPTGFYNKRRASNIVGAFYERYIAYLLGGSKTFNPNAQSPDVQLMHPDSLEQSLLFEVKAGHRTGGIVLKRKQLEVFSKLNNCLYAVAFHQIMGIQKQWSEAGEPEEWYTSAKGKIRKELECPSSVFIVPTKLMVDFYMKNESKQQPMPHYGAKDENYVGMVESQMKLAFEEYKTNSKKTIERWVHIISDELGVDSTRTKHPFIIRI